MSETFEIELLGEPTGLIIEFPKAPTAEELLGKVREAKKALKEAESYVEADRRILEESIAKMQHARARLKYEAYRLLVSLGVE